MGIAPDLMDASRLAIRTTIACLVREHGLAGCGHPKPGPGPLGYCMPIPKPIAVSADRA
jgi:hypothetical protein